MPRLTEVFGGRLQRPPYPLCGPLRVAAQAQGGKAGGLRGSGGRAGERAGAPEARERHDGHEVRFRLARIGAAGAVTRPATVNIHRTHCDNLGAVRGERDAAAGRDVVQGRRPALPGGTCRAGRRHSARARRICDRAAVGNGPQRSSGPGPGGAGATEFLAREVVVYRQVVIGARLPAHLDGNLLVLQGVEHVVRWPASHS